MSLENLIFYKICVVASQNNMKTYQHISSNKCRSNLAIHCNWNNEITFTLNITEAKAIVFYSNSEPDTVCIV